MTCTAADQTLPEFGTHRTLAAGFIALVVLLGGFGLWASATTIAGAVIAPGRVEFSPARHIVQHIDGGRVTEIRVREGETVSAGDLLLRLDGSALQSERAIVENQFHELLARRGRLETERDAGSEIVFPATLRRAAETDATVAQFMRGERDIFEARRVTVAAMHAKHTEQRSQTHARIAGLDAQLAALTRQQDLIDRERADQQRLLDRGLTRSSRVRALEREAATLAGRLGEVSAERLRLVEQLSEIALDERQFITRRREEIEMELLESGYRIHELTERLRALSERITRLDLRAPVTGVVHVLTPVTAHAILRPAEPALAIVPQDRPPVIAVRIAPRDIDKVAPGQPVTIRIPALAETLAGHLGRISPETHFDDITGTVFFRAEAIPDTAPSESADGPRLLSGMPTEVHIRSADRSPLAYLLGPLTGYFSRAFRES